MQRLHKYALNKKYSKNKKNEFNFLLQSFFAYIVIKEDCVSDGFIFISCLT